MIWKGKTSVLESICRSFFFYFYLIDRRLIDSLKTLVKENAQAMPGKQAIFFHFPFSFHFHY